MKRKLMLLLGVMLFIAAAGAIIIHLAKPTADTDVTVKDKKLKIVATFYPMYLIGLNIADQAGDIEVKSLTKLNTGCLHDYQLTTEDMKLISDADVLVINGGGMEGFINDIKKNYPKLDIIDASQGITMLTEGSESYSGKEDITLDKTAIETLAKTSLETPTEMPTEIPAQISAQISTETSSEVSIKASADTSTDISAETPTDTSSAASTDTSLQDSSGSSPIISTDNPHVWLDPELYIRQIENVRDGLESYLDNSDTFSEIEAESLKQNIENGAAAYIQEVTGINSDLEDLAGSFNTLSGQQSGSPQAVIFHDAFAYLASRAGLKIAFSVPLDADTSLSAGDIAAIINEVRRQDIKYLFTEQQYSDSIAKQIAAETDSKVFIIDSVVTGDGAKDSYLKAMRGNLEVLKEALLNN